MYDINNITLPNSSCYVVTMFWQDSDSVYFERNMYFMYSEGLKIAFKLHPIKKECLP